MPRPKMGGVGGFEDRGRSGIDKRSEPAPVMPRSFLPFLCRLVDGSLARRNPPRGAMIDGRASCPCQA